MRGSWARHAGRLSGATAIEVVLPHRLIADRTGRIGGWHIRWLVSVAELGGARELEEESLDGGIDTGHTVIRGLVPELSLFAFSFGHERDDSMFVCVLTM